MSNLTPFEIRLELLKMAKEMLTEEYYGKRDQISQDWQVKVESAKIHGQAIPEHPTLPPYPTETEVITKAQSLNGFVSNTPSDKVSKKSA
jgi:hypothetical protein